MKMETEEHRPQGEHRAADAGIRVGVLERAFLSSASLDFQMKFIVVVITSLQRRSTAELGADKQTQSVIPFA